MNPNAFDYYQDVVCLKPLDKKKTLCCQYKGHNGPCDDQPLLYLVDYNILSQRYTLQVVISNFIKYLRSNTDIHTSIFTDLDDSKREIALACLTFDFVCYASVIHETKKYISWDEDLDKLRRSIYSHVSRTSIEIRKLDINIFSSNRILICAITGKNITFSTFIDMLSHPEIFVKPNMLLKTDQVYTNTKEDYSGPMIIPITRRAAEVVGSCTLFHDIRIPKNWRSELKAIVEFQKKNTY